ncbi:uncharacterized protein Z519_01755 [Cladophialophora bantiana CBS 173.52]|uniref:Sister chromatid cohesion protein Dcc1 n=1 Tax=Cladophialophora bantiana (strain ATCC 10958 / CBS 173.52 / CDC B-1940 / NIH 8579) TaxID=1442370 RepID=A0A0D2F7U9_CLAB1|nr:uncharacterized protein Z519_01755 [Cladophialophora bantiana CBS 173.52]KIW98171.1 hypothetical protein Z519_01755 [Cladophialophora bantiana CBS 173.52]
MSASSQPHTFPPVAVSSTFPQQSLRLLELPPELLDLVETQVKSPSKRRKLWFKSPVAANTGPTKGEQQRLTGFSRGPNSQVTTASGGGLEEAGGEGFLHLCTDDKIWAVKQVSTSNSVYVTQTCYRPHEPPLLGHGEKDRDRDGDTSMTGAEEAQAISNGAISHDVDELTVADGRRGGITTKAQVKNVLELIEVEPDGREVERRILDMIPVYHDTDDDADLLDQDGLGNGRSLHGLESVSLKDVLDNIPAPKRLIQDTMRKWFIFALPQLTTQKSERPREAVYIPTTTLLLRHWREFLQQCTISGINIEKNDGVLRGKDLRAMLDELKEAEATDEGRSLALNVTVAILRRFTHAVEDGSDTVHRDLPTLLDPNLSLDSVDEEHPPSARLKFNPNLSRELVGRWLLLSHARKQASSLPDSLESHGQGRIIRLDNFVNEWAQLLPDSWAVQCDVPRLISSIHGVDVIKDGEGVEVLTFASGHPASEAAGASSSHLPFFAAGGDGGVGLSKDAQSQNQKKRKWHEKFGAQRSAPAVRK